MNRLLQNLIRLGLTVLLVSAAFAGSGKIAGTVVDEYGDGMIGANVQIMETSQGANITNVDGSFVILGVEPGSYTVRISSVGYGTQNYKNVKVSSDLTTTINATMKEEAITIGTVDVEYKKPDVILDQVDKRTRFTKEELSTRSFTDIKSLVVKQPGFKIDADGAIHVRGGRDHELLVKMDGIDQRDPIFSSSKRLVNFSALNVEEIEIMTGGDASVGGFQSALINVTTPEGSMKDLAGVVEYRTDRAFDNSSFNTDQYDYSLSGPLPFVSSLMHSKENKLSFFTSGTAKLTNTYTPYAVHRQASDYLGLGFDLTERQSNDFSTFWKLTYRLDPAKKVNFSYTRDYSLWDLYPDGEAAISGNYGWQYKYDPANRPYSSNKRQSFNLQFSHNVSQKTLYEISFGRFESTASIRPRGKAPDQFTLRNDIEDQSIRDGNGGGDQNNNGIQDGYIDANDDEQYNGEGEGYDDLNQNGQWDRGEDWVDLNDNGVYDPAEPWLDRPNAQGINNLGVFDSWDPFVDLNHNGRWDNAEPQLAEQDWNHNGQWDGERFIDANSNGRYDGFGEGYDDRNGNGKIDKQNMFTSLEDQGEGLIDGDIWNDTGEPFIDRADSDGVYNGLWDPGEEFLDLPSSNTGNGLGGVPTRDGRYDGPNGGFDEYELFTYLANMEFGMDPRQPVIYTWANLIEHFPAGEPEWLNMGFDSVGTPLYAYWIPGKSTWINTTSNDMDNPVFNGRNGRYDPGEVFTDFNGNGRFDGRQDNFLNPGQWDSDAFWQERESIEWSNKFDITSQLNKSHELKSGFEVKYRELNMFSIIGPDELYANQDNPLPADAPYPDRGRVRDQYNHKPWEGSFYVQDKMEFEGLIVRAGVRSDFIIQSNGILEQSQKQVDENQPGALLAKRGRFVVAPRLGISHPVSDRSKLYFNYGHYYQTPSFQYFYKAATANIDPNTTIGNPNLEYEKTVSYEVGVNTEFAEDWVIDVAGYYRDVYNQIGTVDERVGPITLNRYFNLGYARARGFKFSLEKKFSSMWSLTGNYDFSFAFGKESAAAEGLLQRVNNVPENRNEHPLDWDETHKVSAFGTFMVNESQRPNLFGIRLPSDWLTTVEFSYSSGLPYTPSKFITGLPDNLILTNSARKTPTSQTDLRFDKFWELAKGLRLSTGFEIFNLFNRQNVRDVYAATGNSFDSTHEADQTQIPDGNLGDDYDHNPRNYYPPRQALLHMKLNF